MVAETAEGKLRLTRAVLRKDAPQAPDPNEQVGGERERTPPVFLTMFEEVALTLSLRLGQTMTRVGSDDGDGGHGARDGLDSAHGPRNSQPTSPRSSVTATDQRSVRAEQRASAELEFWRQGAPKRKGDEPTEDVSRDPRSTAAAPL